MQKDRAIELRGRILPEIRNVSLPEQKVNFDDPRGFLATYHFSINNSDVVINCKFCTEIENHAAFILARAYEIVTPAINLYAFSKGIYLQLIIDSIVENGKARPVVLSERSVEKFCLSFKNDDEFNEVLSLVLPNLNLRFAFSDLIFGLGNLNHSSISAARCVEAIRNTIAPNPKETLAWSEMRRKLNLDRAYIQLITDASRKHRHGDRGEEDGQLQLEITHRAWKIMDRCIEYLKRGNQDALSESDFPELKG